MTYAQRMKIFYKAHENDLALIGNKIEAHNFQVVYDKDSGEFLKVPTKVSFAACKNKACKLCKEITELGKIADEVAHARIISRGWEKASLYSIARLADTGMNLEDIAEALETTPEVIRWLIKDDIESERWSMEDVVRLFRTTFQVSTTVMYELIPYTAEDVRKAILINGKKLTTLTGKPLHLEEEER